MSGASWSPARWRLPNGLTVLHQENPASAAVTASLSVAAGAVFEGERHGLATLVGRGLTRGTASRSKHDIGEILDFRGAHLAGGAGRHDAALVARARAADFEPVIELLADCVSASTYPEGEAEKLKGDRLTGLREEQDDPAAMVMHAFRELVFPDGHVYATRLHGTEATVAPLQADDLRDFHERLYKPERALLVVVGGIEASAAKEIVEGCLSGWQAAGAGDYVAAQVHVDDVAPGQHRRQEVVIPDKVQSELAVGHVGIRRCHELYYAAALMNMVLGRFAMGGRLGRSVREEQGLAYSTYSSLAAGIGPGPFVVRAGVQPEHIDAAVASIRVEIDRIRTESVPGGELDDARSAAIRSLPRTLESNEGVAGLLQQIELYGLGLDYVERYAELVGEVDAAQVLAAAESILHPEALVEAVAGPGMAAGS